jgi:hypothetical protein
MGSRRDSHQLPDFVDAKADQQPAQKFPDFSLLDAPGNNDYWSPRFGTALRVLSSKTTSLKTAPWSGSGGFKLIPKHSRKIMTSQITSCSKSAPSPQCTFQNWTGSRASARPTSGPLSLVPYVKTGLPLGLCERSDARFLIGSVTTAALMKTGTRLALLTIVASRWSQVCTPADQRR